MREHRADCNERTTSLQFSEGGGGQIQRFFHRMEVPGSFDSSASTMAVWQRDLPQEWEVRPAPDKSGARWRKKEENFSARWSSG